MPGPSSRPCGGRWTAETEEESCEDKARPDGGLWDGSRGRPGRGKIVALQTKDPHLETMGTEFEVHRVFHLPERSLFGLVGVIRNGMVEVGMEAVMEGQEDAFSARVHGVEFLDSEDPEAPGSEPALLFSYSRPEKLERWQAVEWSGRVLRLSWGRR